MLIFIFKANLFNCVYIMSAQIKAEKASKTKSAKKKDKKKKVT